MAVRITLIVFWALTLAIYFYFFLNLEPPRSKSKLVSSRYHSQEASKGVSSYFYFHQVLIIMQFNSLQDSGQFLGNRFFLQCLDNGKFQVMHSQFNPLFAKRGAAWSNLMVIILELQGSAVQSDLGHILLTNNDVVCH